jgi:hypothetical protein
MNTTNHNNVMFRRTLVATAVASILLAAACATAPVKPDGAAEARVKLTQLQSDPNLASRAAVAIKDADAAGPHTRAAGVEQRAGGAPGISGRP